MHATDIRPILNFKIHFDVEIRRYTGYSDYCWEFLRLIYLILVSQLAASGAQATYHSPHRRQPRRRCRGRIPTNILAGGDINGNVPTNIRGGNVVEYELLIASVKREQS